MALIEEEVVVVELNRIDTIDTREVREDGRGSLGRFDLLPRFVDRHDAAEVAAECTADASVVGSGAGAIKDRQDVFLRRHEAMIGEPGEIVGRAQRPDGVVDVQPEIITEREAADTGKFPSIAQGSEQFEKSILALAANRKIDVAGVESGVRIKRWEVAAPDNWHGGSSLADGAAKRDRGGHLRPGHD